MGTDYTVYLVAAPPAHEYRPDADTAARLVAGLGSLGWIDLHADACVLATGKTGERRQRATTSFATLTDDLRTALAAHPSVLLEPKTPPQERHWPAGSIDSAGRSRMYEFEQAARLEARYCDSLSLIWTEALCTVFGENVGRLPCPTCGDNLLDHAESLLDGKAVPSACRSCGGAVAPELLVAETHDVMTGELRMEPMPLFRFAICVTVAPNALPEHEPVAVDEGLLAMLSTITGARWRALASLG
jgi:hypothetical protein